MVAVAAMFSSCKKSTDTSILEGHKWVLKTATETYSDSGAISHNLLAGDTLCPTTRYTEFHGPETNAVLKLAYTYITATCSPYSFPDVGLTTWDIDPDNTVLYLDGNVNNGGEGGIWYTITSISSSQLVLTIVNQRVIGQSNTGGNIYDVATDTWTYGTM